MSSDKVSNEGSIGSRIRDYRELAGIEQKELAKILKVSVQAVSQYELGKRNPGVKLLNRIAQELGVSVQELIDGGTIERLNSTGDNNQRGRQEAGLTQAKLGRNIKRFRKEKGLTQGELTQLLKEKYNVEIVQSTVSQYELGIIDIGYSMVFKIADVLDVSVAELVNGDIAEIKMKAGDNIKKFRADKEWTQEQLAEKVGISKNGLWNYENGKREIGIDTLSKIADALDVSMQGLIGESSLNTVSRLSGIGGNIKKARKAKGMGQDEFAEALGKSLRMIQKYEAEEYSNTRVIPALEVIEDIANVLDISMQDLIGLGGEDESNSDVTQFENKELVDERLIQKLSNRIFRLYNDEKIKEYEINIKDNSFSFYVLWSNGYGGIIKGNMNEECKSLDKFVGDIEELGSDIDGNK